MDYSVNLIALLATGFGLALFFGYLANYFKISTLVGGFISIALNPTLFKLSRPFLEWYERKRRYFY
jgi:predicted Kef-type K+ transport protein